jgi:hypothetical protein
MLCADPCVLYLFCMPPPTHPPCATPVELPPGRYVSQGLVRVCPQGFWRENYVEFDNANGTTCTACRPGISTDGPGATSAAQCNKVEPGYGIRIINVTSDQPLPTVADLPTPSDGLPAATMCDFGYYSSKGSCVQCPFATVTRARGAASVEECSECHGALAVRTWGRGSATETVAGLQAFTSCFGTGHHVLTTGDPVYMHLCLWLLVTAHVAGVTVHCTWLAGAAAT